MKNFIVLMILVFGFPISKVIAQKSAANTSGTTSQSSHGSGNYSVGSTYNNAGGSAGYATHVDANNSAQAQAVIYRNIIPVASGANISTTGVTAPDNNYVGNSGAHNTQAIMRYNYAAKGVYPYYPSAKTKKRDHTQRDEIADADQFSHLHEQSTYIPFCNTLYTTESLCSQPLFYNTFYAYSNSALNRSFDGYIVYGNDTLSGIVTLAPDAALLEQPIDSNGENGYKFLYKDDVLKSVVVFNDQQELYLTRTSAMGELLRVLHNGKLTIYDDVYSFPTVDNIDQSHMKIAYDGELKQLGAFVVLDMKNPLMKTVNKVYGLNLKATDMSWDNLVLYINKLN